MSLFKKKQVELVEQPSVVVDDSCQKKLDMVIELAQDQQNQVKSIMDKDAEIEGDINQIHNEFDSMVSNMDTLEGNINSFHDSFQSLSETVDEYRKYQSKVHESMNLAQNRVNTFSDDSMEMMNRLETLDSSFNELAESVENIGNCAKGIEAVAAQTNLLSLNASIEAARAGEAG